MGYRVELLAQCLAGRAPPSTGLVAITNLANHYLVTPQLFVAQSGYCGPSPEDREVRDYWEAVFRANDERNARLQEQLGEVLEILNSVGVAPLLLTGAGALATSARTSGRMVADLDIMLCPGETERGIRALLESGYIHWDEKNRRHTAAKLIKPPHIGLLHVHHRPPDAGTSMSAESMARGGRMLEFRSHCARLPSPTDRLCYLIGHDMIEARGLLYGDLHLRHLLDAVEAFQSGPVDWNAIRARFSSGMRSLACAMYLYNLNRLFAIAGWPHSLLERVPGILFQRQMMRSERRLYAAVDQTLLVLPIRAAFWIGRNVQSALRTDNGPIRAE